MSSFGLNQLHPRRFTNLPGMAGGNLLKQPSRRSSPKQTNAPVARLSPTRAEAASRVARPEPAAEPPRAEPPRAEPARVEPPRAEPHDASRVQEVIGSMRTIHQESQWVYATAAVDLRDAHDDGEAVAVKGDRLLLVYPMASDEATGRVTMRVKRCDAVTGQLTLSTVVVFDPDEDPQHRVTDFSLCS